jgi:hypothetical protein
MFKNRRRLTKNVGVSLTRAAMVAVISALVALLVVSIDPIPNVSEGLTSTTTTTTTTTTPTITVPTSTTSTTAPAPGGLIVSGPSRSECLTPDLPPTAYGLPAVQAAVTSFDDETDTKVTCLSAYLLGETNWSQWVDPWITNWKIGYSAWVAQEPTNRELVLAVSLIPLKLENEKNPLIWESACAKGAYNSYATELGDHLVSSGLGNSVLRLGPEMNGKWEPYFIGKTTAEQHQWAVCFANEVTGLRKAPGEHFLIDWNPNACKGNYTYTNFYPGNAYVDIVGLDLYDVGCLMPTTRLSFAKLAGEQEGLAHFEAFAAAEGKPMSLPEWGLSSVPAGDDPGYVDGIGAAVTEGNFAFETYFEGIGPNIKAIPLGTHTPLSLAAFKEWFSGDS